MLATTDTVMPASYLSLPLDMVSEDLSRKKIYDKRDYFIIPIVNFPFIFSNTPIAPAYGVYIFQLI